MFECGPQNRAQQTSLFCYPDQNLPGKLGRYWDICWMAGIALASVQQVHKPVDLWDTTFCTVVHPKVTRKFQVSPYLLF